MKKLAVILSIFVTLGLVLGGTGLVAAEEDTGSDPRGIFGVVTNVTVDDDGNGVISLDGKDPVNVDAATLFHVPGFVPPWQAWTNMTDAGKIHVKGAQRVAILLTPEVGDRLAQKVMVIKSQYRARGHVIGVVTAIDGDTVTIVNKKGEEVTMTLPDGIELEVGDYVTLVAFGTSDAARTCVRAHKMEQLINRFEHELQYMKKQADFDRVNALLEKARERHMEVLEGIRDRWQEQNKGSEKSMEALNRAIQNAQTAYENLAQKREQVRDRVQNKWDQWFGQWIEVQGNITAVDLEANTVTIAPDEGDEVVMEVVDYTRITKAGTLVDIGDLAPGDKVNRAVYSSETMEAALIVVCPAEASSSGAATYSRIAGVVTALDADLGTITIKPAVGDEVVITVVDGTRLVKSGRYAEFSDLEVGDVVREAFYSPDTLEARAITVLSAKGR